jgi:hypothetical protein
MTDPGHRALLGVIENIHGLFSTIVNQAATIPRTIF